VQAAHTEILDRLLADSMALQSQMGMLDESGRRAANAAREGLATMAEGGGPGGGASAPSQHAIVTPCARNRG